MTRTTTTHTVDMAQVADLNVRLTGQPQGQTITAADLGLEGAAASGSRGGKLSGSTVLVRVCWDGAPEFPSIHGHFSSSGAAEGSLVVDLHTQALRELSHRLHAHHLWGQGSAADTPRGH